MCQRQKESRTESEHFITSLSHGQRIDSAVITCNDTVNRDRVGFKLLNVELFLLLPQLPDI